MQNTILLISAAARTHLVRGGAKVALRHSTLTCFQRTYTSSASQQSAPNLNLTCQIHKQAERFSDRTDSELQASAKDAGNFRKTKKAEQWILQNLESDQAVTKLCQMYEKGDPRVAEIVDAVPSHLIKIDKFDDAVSFIRYLMKKDVRINQGTCNELLKQFVEERQKNFDADLEHRFAAFIQLMSEKGYEISNPKVVYPILKMASMVGNGQMAQNMFNRLIENKNYGKEILYGLLLRAYIKEARRKNDFRNHEAVMRCFDEVTNDKVVIKAHDIKAFIENCVLAGAANDARSKIIKLEQMKNADFFLGYLDVLVRVEPLLRSGDYNSAQKIFGMGKYSNDCEIFSCLFDMRVINSVDQVKDDIPLNNDQSEAHGKIYRLIRDKGVHEAIGFAENLVRKNILLSHITYQRLLKGLVEQKKVNLNPQTEIVNGELIDKQFYSFLEFMADNGYTLTDEGQYWVLRMACLLKDGGLAQIAFNKLKSSDEYILRADSYGLLLGALCAEARQKKDYSNQGLASKCFDEVTKKGLEVTDHNVKLFIENSLISETPEIARTLLKQLNEKSSQYLEYLDVLVRVEPLLREGETNTARRICKDNNHQLRNEFMRCYVDNLKGSRSTKWTHSRFNDILL